MNRPLQRPGYDRRDAASVTLSFPFETAPFPVRGAQPAESTAPAEPGPTPICGWRTQ